MDLGRLSISQITTVKWDLPTAVDKYREHGVGAIGPWFDKLGEVGLERGLDLIRGRGLGMGNYCAAGFFTMNEAGPDAAVEATRQAIDEAARLQTPCLVVVSGPISRYGWQGAMDIILPRLKQVAGIAEEKGVNLGLEALHPMDIAQWSMIRTLHQALDIIEEIDSPNFGLLLDLYNTWWDPKIFEGIRRSGPFIKGVHLADWRDPTRSAQDRTLPGRGVAPLKELIGEVEQAGWKGLYEVEIFSEELWESDYDQMLDEIVDWFRGV